MTQSVNTKMMYNWRYFTIIQKYLNQYLIESLKTWFLSHCGVSCSRKCFNLLHCMSIICFNLLCLSLPQVSSSEEGVYRFAAQTLASQTTVLVTVVIKAGEVTGKLTTNCEKMTIGAMLMKDVKQSLEAQ